MGCGVSSPVKETTTSNATQQGAAGAKRGKGSDSAQAAQELTGTSVLTGSRDGTLRLWCLQRNECVGVLKGHTDHVRCMSVSWLQNKVLTGSSDNTLRLWDLASCTCIREFRGGLLGEGADTTDVDELGGTVRDVPEGKEHEPDVPAIHAGLCVAMDPSANEGISAALDHSLRMWNLNSGECSGLLSGHTDTIWCVVADWANRMALTGSQDSTLRLWNLKAKSCTQVFQGHHKTVNSVAADWQAGRFLSGSNDNTLRLWSMKNGQCLKLISADHVRCVCMDWDGMRAVSSGDANALRLWNLETGNLSKDVPGGRYSRCVEVDWQRQLAITGGNDGVVHVWDLRSGRMLREIWGHSSEILCVALNWPCPPRNAHQP